MSDTSEDEDLSKFREAVDNSFLKNINNTQATSELKSKENETNKQKSERYLEVANHYNDVKVPEELQRQIAAKISNIIAKKIKFVDIEPNGIKKRKIKGGVKLFKDSDNFLSCEDPKDTYTEKHNAESKRIKRKKQQIEDSNVNEIDKLKAVAVTGEYVLSKEETKCWKSRRKEKIFKYKKHGKSKVLTAVE
ncbi:uncharacterized protein LOC113515128 [Galleria mellonella]|uniref:Uncharacterized protein LOC113515128 n=1 Tax=Galleria mellonella TaxID=7137 RepID=A0A6J3C0L5_GALME|nr:uncharacterized protein LOC113515128 [Galleria mellonella]XP_031764454.2 uncharacterized protein LOC113515128 [Galleria mellonella]